MKSARDKVKIIFVGRYNPEEILSGPEKVAKRIFTELKDKTEAVFIEYFFDGSKYSFYKKLFGKEQIASDSSSKILRLGIFQIVLFIINYKPKLIHILSFERFVLIILFLKKFIKYKISYTVHGIVQFENYNFRKDLSISLEVKNKIVEYFLMKFSNKLFFLSEQSMKLAGGYYNFPTGKINFINNGVDEVFHEIFLKRKNSEKSKLNVVIVADSKRAEKGLDFFMKAIQPIKNDFIFSIIGENLIQDYHLEYYRKMATSEFANFLLNQDIIISSSSFDTFHLTTLEAMSVGVIPIITKETGVSRFLFQGENGFIYSYGDEESLRKYLLKLKNDSKLRLKISQNAAAIYYKFRWEDIANKYLEKFYEMLSE